MHAFYRFVDVFHDRISFTHAPGNVQLTPTCIWSAMSHGAIKAFHLMKGHASLGVWVACKCRHVGYL